MTSDSCLFVNTALALCCDLQIINEEDYGQWTINN